MYGTTENPIIEQTTDFGGDAENEFGQFDLSDGGQIAVLVRGWASLIMTQDGNTGVGWFIGQGCRHSREDAKLSWLAFNGDAPAGRWAETTSRLTLQHASDVCPNHFGVAYLRYRHESVSFHSVSWKARRFRTLIVRWTLSSPSITAEQTSPKQIISSASFLLAILAGYAGSDGRISPCTMTRRSLKGCSIRGRQSLSDGRLLQSARTKLGPSGVSKLDHDRQKHHAPDRRRLPLAGL